MPSSRVDAASALKAQKPAAKAAPSGRNACASRTSARIDNRAGRLLYSRRLGIVEPVFGNLHHHHLRRFTFRTRRKVDAQWKLFALVHNVQKLQGKAP
jgi:hypothetical protein